MIPKKIHYIWLGEKEKDRASQICINSWKRQLPEYDIIEWSEKNLPIANIEKTNKFFHMCKKYKLWAFMSDYLRLWILYREGGIYLDTDVQVVKKFDDLLQYPMFLGYEMNDYIGTGIIGAEKENPLIFELLNFYEKEIWKVDYYNNPIIFSNILQNKTELKKECVLLERDMLSPYNPMKKYGNNAVENDKTYTIHWFNANWGMSRKGYVFLNTKHYLGIKKYIAIIRKNIGYLIRKCGFKKF